MGFGRLLTVNNEELSFKLWHHASGWPVGGAKVDDEVVILLDEKDGSVLRTIRVLFP